MVQVTNIAFIRAKHGRSEDLGRHLLDLVEPSRSEPGCINYDVHWSADEPALWFVYEGIGLVKRFIQYFLSVARFNANDREPFSHQRVMEPRR